jgi:apolipoprotein N-acyltransferase
VVHRPITDDVMTTTSARLALRVVASVAAGLTLWLAFPSHDQWWLAPVSVALLAGATLGPRPRTSLLLGLVGGLAFFVPTLSWSGIYVGPLPWLALAAVQALYVALMCLVANWVWRRLRDRDHRWLAYAVVPLAWVVQEYLRSRTPFGGFPWVRLAFSQADSPLARLAAYGGAPLVTAAVAVCGTGLLVLAHAVVRRQAVPATVGMGVLVVPFLVGGVTSLPTDGRHEQIALIQGNVPKPGLDFNAERRKVLDNHVQGTLRLLDDATSTPQLIVWPENASDIDPLRNADARSEIQTTVERAGVPLLIGAILDEPSPKVSNASLFYRPGHAATPERYVKQHPVPFAEYVPFRSFFRIFSDKVDLVRAGFAAGDGPAAFRVGSGDAAWWAVPTICFEVAYDGLVRGAVTQPGRTDNVLVVQTNNATFGFTDESEQQFAISRIRAIEHGRSVAHVSTVGVSGIINPDGSVQRTTKLFTADQVVGDVVVRSSLTVADRVGELPELLAGVGLLALVLLGLTGTGRGRVAARRSADDPTDDAADDPQEEPIRV